MTRTVAVLVAVGVLGWGVASGAGVALAAGAFPQGERGGTGIRGAIGAAGPAGVEGPVGLTGPRGLGGESGMWRDYSSDPSVVGTGWDASALRTAIVGLGRSECGALNSGRTPEELVTSDGDIPLGVQRAILDAAIDNLCPDYGTNA